MGKTVKVSIELTFEYSDVETDSHVASLGGEEALASAVVWELQERGIDQELLKSLDRAYTGAHLENVSLRHVSIRPVQWFIERVKSDWLDAGYDPAKVEAKIAELRDRCRWRYNDEVRGELELELCD